LFFCESTFGNLAQTILIKMVSSPDNFDRLFPEAAQTWDLDRLYADLDSVSIKPLKPFEKACLRGLLCRYRPGQLAFKLAWTSGAIRVELNKGLYRYIEDLTEQPPNTLRWEKISEWLEAKGYRSVQQVDRLVPSTEPITQGRSRNIADWGEAPEVPVFFGRTAELNNLENWILRDNCRVSAVWGMGGIGKTALSVKLVEKIHGKFEYLIWRSLRNAQPMQLFLPDILRFISDGKADFNLSYLIDTCKKHRCLLVLDDYETIMRDGELVGPYRPGYEAYAELLERLGGERHQSCVIVISREQPKEIAVLQGEDSPVRSLKLGGMDRQAARSLLTARGFKGSEGGLEDLIQQYRGNPSALRIVATTIRELFNGNVSDFLKQTTLALGDILRNLLYQQFERLSELEKDVLYWLALKRRPASLSELREDMRLHDSASELIDALESLRWRSLIEQTVDKGTVMFVLEPVVMKYVNKKFVEEASKEVDEVVKNSSLSKLNLLSRHALVEDKASDTIRAVQIRLVLKPIKDRLGVTLRQVGKSTDLLSEQLATSHQNRSPSLDNTDSLDYMEANLTLLGLLV
jgi:DNA-binding transcriptional regulator GbsR (MarR family)